jgi:hypothetical protein
VGGVLSNKNYLSCSNGLGFGSNNLNEVKEFMLLVVEIAVERGILNTQMFFTLNWQLTGFQGRAGIYIWF